VEQIIVLTLDQTFSAGHASFRNAATSRIL
jgi:hypothetical protein